MAVRTNIKRTLGATYPVGASQVVLFIPDHSRDGDSIDQQYWVDEALNVMGRLFRGATAFPPGRGVWRDDEAGGGLLKERTVMVVSYVAPELLAPATLKSLRSFCIVLDGKLDREKWGLLSTASITEYRAMTFRKPRRLRRWLKK